MSNNQVVLITGGTKGLGLATALEFARVGYQCVLTYGWGSVDNDRVLSLFSEKNYLLPLLVQADVVNRDDTEQLLTTIKDKLDRIDALISNVSFSSLITKMDDYSEKALLKSIEYSSWPLVEYTKMIYKILGKYPRYVFGLSSHGPDRFHCNYDFAAITKTVMEVLVKYLNYHFFEQDVIFNIIRTRPVVTDSLVSTLGKEWIEFMEKFDIKGTEVDLAEIGKAIVAMSSGLMDGVRGQTITVDKGYDFADGLQHVYLQYLSKK